MCLSIGYRYLLSSKQLGREQLLPQLCRRLCSISTCAIFSHLVHPPPLCHDHVKHIRHDLRLHVHRRRGKQAIDGAGEEVDVSAGIVEDVAKEGGFRVVLSRKPSR